MRQSGPSNIQMKKPKYQEHLRHLPSTEAGCRSVFDGSFASHRGTYTIEKLIFHHWDLYTTTSSINQKIVLRMYFIRIVKYHLWFRKYFSLRMKQDRKNHCTQL